MHLQESIGGGVSTYVCTTTYLGPLFFFGLKKTSFTFESILVICRNVGEIFCFLDKYFV